MKDHEYFYMPGLYNEWLDPKTSQFVNTVAIGVTEGNTMMSQVDNSKKRMPTVLTENLAIEAADKRAFGTDRPHTDTISVT